MGNPRRHEPRWNDILDQASWEFRLTWTLNGIALSMVSSLKKALPFRAVELALWLDFLAAVVVEETREVAESVGAPVLPIQEHEVAEALSKERVSERIVERIARSVLVDVIKDRIAQNMVDLPRPRMRHEIAEAVQLCVWSPTKTGSQSRWWISQCLRSRR